MTTHYHFQFADEKADLVTVTLRRNVKSRSTETAPDTLHQNCKFLWLQLMRRDLNYTPENIHSHAYAVKAKFLQENALTNVIHSDIFLLFNFKKILIATTDWKTVLSDIQIFLHNFPSRIVFAFLFENERVVAFFSCQSSQCLSQNEVSRSGEPGSFLELKSRNTEWPGHSSSEREWIAFTEVKAIPFWKPGRVGQETVKRPVNALSCQDHHTVPPKIRQGTDVG